MTASMKRVMPLVKRIALVAHNNKKQDLLEWAAFNRELLKQHALHATGNTGNLLRQKVGLDVPVLRVRDGRKGQSFMRIHEVQPRRSRPFLTAIAPRRSRA
jgi:hypothetical protein